MGLANGDLKRCYEEPPFMNIFDETLAEIPTIPVRRHCKLRYCINSSHFLALGAISGHDNEFYAEIRNRENGWIKNEVLRELSTKLILKEHEDKWEIGNIKNNIIIYGAGIAAHEIMSYERL